jgi:hypothetical protein
MSTRLVQYFALNTRIAVNKNIFQNHTSKIVKSNFTAAYMVAEVGGVFGTLTQPQLILPYSAYYGHLASLYGSPWCSPMTQWCNTKHLQVPEPPIY